MTTGTKILSRRALGRATLARQHLLERSDLDAFGMIEHLVGMQAQAPWPPYAGLWSRLRDFGHDELAQLLLDRSVTRILLQRGTVHLVTAADCFLLRPVVQPVIDRMYVTARQVASAGGRDPDVVAEVARDLLGTEAMTPAELGTALADRFGGGATRALADLARARLPLVQTPPRAVWGRGGATRYALADRYLSCDEPNGRTPDRGDSPLQGVIRRYLAAFGPATVMDIQAWCGLTRLREVTETMSGLVTFRAEDGRPLLDLPDAPRPDEDVAAPVRFLPEFDNVILSHADRSRIIDETHRPAVFNNRGMVAATLLLDGQVAGTWTSGEQSGGAVITVSAFAAKLTEQQRSEIEAEGSALGRFLSAPSDIPVAVSLR